MTPLRWGWRDLLPRPWDERLPALRDPAGWETWARSMPPDLDDTIGWDRLNERP
jgi:hypothetical protein